jgi:hypothetical protein
MTDLLDDLRDANPIDPDELDVPPYAHRVPRPPRRRRRHFRPAVAAVAVALLIVAVIALIPGRAAKHGDDLAARAYAAVTKPGVVHWRTALRTHVGGEGNTQMVAEGWSHKGVTHILMWELYNHRPHLELDMRTADGRTTTWSSASDHVTHGKAARTGSNPNYLGDPMAIFRRAYQAGKLSPLGPNRLAVDLPGRSDNQGDYTAYYDIDPKTSLPLRYITAEPNGSRSTLQIRVYETLPFDAATRAKLRLLRHPSPASAHTTAAAHFAVLRQGAPPTGKLGAAIKQIASSRHLDASAARKIAPRLALIPSSDGVCLITANASGSGFGCVGLTQALKRGIGVGVPNPAPLPRSAHASEWSKAGVDLAVPDGVVAVKTRFHGIWTRRPVHGNFVHIPRFSGQYVLVRR